MMGNGFAGGWMWLFGLLLVVGIALIILVAVRALGGGISRGNGASRPARSRAREVLDERYARGELTTEEYRERLRTLDEER
jgi:putative membrane protein